MAKPPPGSAEISALFATPLYRARVPEAIAEALNRELAATISAFAEEDEAGRVWCKANGYPGYTSYSSLSDLTVRAPCFADLKRLLDAHCRAFAETLRYDLGGGKLALDHLWVNLLDPGGLHSGHIHPHSVISGTYYVEIPAGAGALRFEDPRLGFMMAAPMRRADAERELGPFVTERPGPGVLLLWESFLRHEVLRNGARTPRLSVSFNYAWR